MPHNSFPNCELFIQIGCNLYAAYLLEISMDSKAFTGAFEKLYDKFYGWFEGLVIMLPNIVAAIVVVGVFGIASIWIGKGTRKFLLRLSNNKPISDLLAAVIKIAVILVGLFIALGLLKLDKTVTSLLAGVGVVGLALGFAFQDIAANFMAGFIMALRRPFVVGDLVETADITGEVLSVELRATRLRTPDGLSVIIPNKDVFQNPIINYTLTKDRRIEVEVGVAYDSDLEQVRDTVMQALEDIPNRENSRKPECYYVGFGGSSINLVARLWLGKSSQKAYFQSRSEAVISIKKAFDAAGIAIPFPIRTLDFGAKAVGGESLQLSMLEDKEHAA